MVNTSSPRSLPCTRGHHHHLDIRPLPRANPHNLLSLLGTDRAQTVWLPAGREPPHLDSLSISLGLLSPHCIVIIVLNCLVVSSGSLARVYNSDVQVLSYWFSLLALVLFDPSLLFFFSFVFCCLSLSCTMTTRLWIILHESIGIDALLQPVFRVQCPTPSRGCSATRRVQLSPSTLIFLIVRTSTQTAPTTPAVTTYALLTTKVEQRSPSRRYCSSFARWNSKT